ncbi:transposase [Burkholderia multivorans]|uniref:RNA-guided endonuclease InsQ/TnpB family protein n=1 Tax=Burkholderia multivorans TaxID=87883 RepID=UPI001C229629|nr:transposase [Burkholderia multivorans]MDN8078835.1 RNA-guided endonuclease TnpB family protein [Burkholderia multivorans]
MTVLLAHEIRLRPTPAQENHLLRACGTARFAWNWALAEWHRQYAAWKVDTTQVKPSEGALRKQLNAIKREQFPWMLEVTKCAPQEAIRSLGIAYSNWFASLSGKRKGPKVGAPRFKKKGVRDSFKIHGELLAVDGSSIRIPNLGWVRMREPLRFAGVIKGATVKRRAHAWLISILVETDNLPPRTESQRAVGVDLGIKALATLSDGTVIEGPKALAGLLARLRRLSRAHSRKVKGSNNRKKSAQRLARLHWRIANVRNDALHKLTHHLTSEYGFIAIEDLNVKGMLANHRLARHIADAGFGEFRRQLSYKAALRGVQLHVLDRWYPSSKTCSSCGSLNEALTLSDRFWVCTACGTTHDRDANAAKNILAEAIRQASLTTPGAGVTVCESLGLAG